MVGAISSRWARVRLALGLLFVGFHLSAALVNVAPPSVREPLWPLFAFYGDGLRLSGRFGVFARYSSKTSVAVYGVLRGERRLLSSSAPPGGSAWQRWLDERIPKIQRKLVRQDVRELFGNEYLAYFCRTAAGSGQRLDTSELELVNYDEPSREVVMSRRCEARDD